MNKAVLAFNSLVTGFPISLLGKTYVLRRDVNKAPIVAVMDKDMTVTNADLPLNVFLGYCERMTEDDIAINTGNLLRRNDGNSRQTN